jgi:maltose alpha-D-glucosyltransferase/alpha-amylase
MSTSSNPFNGRNTAPSWLNDAVFYEIYPQTFCDTDADGIGDFQGITSKLDYIQSLGANALWINPCFDSPFVDAGYDVRNYYKVAKRYGSEKDLVKLFKEAHKRGIKVLLDLVPGHTSEQCEWFEQSKKAEHNEFSDRYVWTSHAFEGGEGLPFIGGESERAATYILNFFKAQPALNYGFGDRKKPWMQDPHDEGPMANREEMVKIIRYWLDKGADGFRVDMADSLVKFDDDEKSHTQEVWRDIFSRIREDYPEAAFVSEWGTPSQALDAGFNMDFYLDWRHNGYNQLTRDTEDQLTGPDDLSFFKQTSGTSPQGFIDEYWPRYDSTKDLGYFSFMSCNHDTPRLAPRLTEAERRLFFIFLFTMPGVPFLYYGDEIGLKYRNLPTKEGGYHRTGSRTPMQWNSKRNKGFSTVRKAEKLYLPVEEEKDAPNVADQEKDPHSLLNYVRALIALRHGHPTLQADAYFRFLWAHDNSRILAFERYSRSDDQDRYVIALNAGEQEDGMDIPSEGEVIFALGDATLDGTALALPPLSGAVIQLGR